MRTLELTIRIGAALALVSPSAFTAAGGSPGRMPNVGVVVRNLSAAAPDMVDKAESACQEIYRAAGIRVTWHNSLDPVAWQGPDIVLLAVILPQAPPSRSAAAFGTALRQRQEVLLYHDRIARFGKIVNLPEHVMLSLALVHEIGHLLLDSDDHASSGIMRGEWGQDDLNAIRQGRLPFTPDQILRMKANIERGSARPR